MATGNIIPIHLTGMKNIVLFWQKDDPFLKNLPPERPIRQHCVVSRSNAYCVNLPGLFLEGIINLDFTLNESESPKTQANLFPGEQDDKFLRALRRHLLNPEKVSFFG